MNKLMNKMFGKFINENVYGGLTAKFNGEVILPDDSDYDEARQTRNGLINKRLAAPQNMILAVTARSLPGSSSRRASPNGQQNRKSRPFRQDFMPKHQFIFRIDL